VRLSGWENRTSASHGAFSRVSGLTSAPSSDARKISAGAVSVDLEKTTSPGPGRAADTAPPSTTAFGTPPVRGTVNSVPRPARAAVNQSNPSADDE